MFTECTFKYNTFLGENVSINVTYPLKENGSRNMLCVPLDTANTHYAEILKQVADGNLTIAPEFTDAEIAANTQAETNATNQAYLASTDWYITRHAETGVAVPADVTTARAAARAAIV